MATRTFFSETQQKKIVQAIQEAEKNTSGEIRVHLDNSCPNDPKERAIAVFNQLKMYQTELRNGVLFYMATQDRKLAIVGDKGINEVVPLNFWDDVRDTMLSHFRQAEFDKGLIKGIEMTGEKLKAFFPFQSNDTNELSNDISFQNTTNETD